MPLGPGKYDEACTAARLATGAEACVLIVVEGAKGSGFSVQADLGFARTMPTMLRWIADEMDRSLS